MTREERAQAFKAKSRAQAGSHTAKGYPPVSTKRLRKPLAQIRPAYGSQQWAETYRDDLGESFD